MMLPIQLPEPLTQNAQWEEIKLLWEATRAHLEAKRTEIYDEIAHYPAPIPACDQHFSYLLEERTNIAREQKRLLAFAGGRLTLENPLAWLDEFIRTSPCISDAVAQTMRPALSVVPPDHEEMNHVYDWWHLASTTRQST